MIVMLEQIITRFQQGKIRLEIDSSLNSHIITPYNNGFSNEFPFRLFDLVYAIGTCRQVAITNANKFYLASDYLNIFTRNEANELLIVDNDNVEQKQKISEEIGEGLSFVIAEKLFNLKRSTISRITRKGNESKPDFKGYTLSNPSLKVVWESKGSTNTIRQNVINHAQNQKIKEPADIAFASFAQLKSDTATEVFLKDPPTIPLEGDALSQQLSKVKHYISVFNFIGQAKLSRYFKLLGKRLENNRDFKEFNEKEELFENIRNKSERLCIHNKFYLGNIEQIDDSIFLFVGFDETLLTVSGFINFEDYENNLTFDQDNNSFKITRDGVCYGYIRNINELQKSTTREIDVLRIPYYQDTLTIRDIDHMLDFQLVEYTQYLFERENFSVEKEYTHHNVRYDLLVRTDGKKIIVEVKQKGFLKSFDYLKGYTDADYAIIVTTVRVSEEDIQYAKDLHIMIMDRRNLKAIINKRYTISDLLKKINMKNKS